MNLVAHSMKWLSNLDNIKRVFKRHKGVFTYLLNEGAYQTGQTRSCSSMLIEELCPTYVACVFLFI